MYMYIFRALAYFLSPFSNIMLLRGQCSTLESSSTISNRWCKVHKRTNQHFTSKLFAQVQATLPLTSDSSAILLILMETWIIGEACGDWNLYRSSNRGIQSLFKMRSANARSPWGRRQKWNFSLFCSIEWSGYLFYKSLGFKETFSSTSQPQTIFLSF